MTTHTASRPAARPSRRGQIDPTPRAAHPEWFAPVAETVTENEPVAQASVRRSAAGSRPAAPLARMSRVQVSHTYVSRAQVRLRRTIAVLVLATIALIAVFVLGRASVHAAQPTPTTKAATPAVVTVQAGDTLWTIATRIAPKSDPRATIRAIRELNGLSTGSVQAGQRLVLPR